MKSNDVVTPDMYHYTALFFSLDVVSKRTSRTTSVQGCRHDRETTSWRSPKSTGWKQYGYRRNEAFPFEKNRYLDMWLSTVNYLCVWCVCVCVTFRFCLWSRVVMFFFEKQQPIRYDSRIIAFVSVHRLLFFFSEGGFSSFSNKTYVRSVYRGLILMAHQICQWNSFWMSVSSERRSGVLMNMLDVLAVMASMILI